MVASRDSEAPTHLSRVSPRYLLGHLRRLCVLISALKATSRMSVTQTNMNGEPLFPDVTQRLFSRFILS